MLSYLESFLVGSYPSDVLKPAAERPGPAKPTWESYAEWKVSCDWFWQVLASLVDIDGAPITKPDLPDICVVLSKLCVVRVGSPAANDALVARFPELDAAPVERTGKGGFQYWFARGRHAVDLGFACELGSVAEGVGLVVDSDVIVAPSQGNRWIRAPWNSPPNEISEGLLEAVAVPSVRPASIDVLCRDGGVVSARRSKTVALSSYFEPFLSEDAPLSETRLFPAPVTSEALLSLTALVDDRACPSFGLESCEAAVCRAASEWVETVRTAADVLGTPLDTVEAALERVAQKVWTARLFPGHASALAREERLLTVPYPLEFKALPEYAELAYGLFSGFNSRSQPEPPSKAESQSEPQPRTLSVSGDPVAAFVSQAPPAVLALLRAHPASLVAAGGFVAGAVLDLAAPGSDVDLFVHSCGPDEADAVLECFLSMPGAALVCRTDLAVTVAVPGTPKNPGRPEIPARPARPAITGGREGREARPGRPGGVLVQLVRRLHADPAQILSSFDLSPCKVLARAVPQGACGDNASFAVECLPSFLETARTMSFVVDFDVWTASSCFRVLKYCSKGFRALTPGVETTQTVIRSFLAPRTDAATLLEVQYAIIRRRIAGRGLRGIRGLSDLRGLPRLRGLRSGGTLLAHSGTLPTSPDPVSLDEVMAACVSAGVRRGSGYEGGASDADAASVPAWAVCGDRGGPEDPFVTLRPANSACITKRL